MSISEAKKHIEDKQFAPGSMLPKVLACISFAETGKEAIIASLNNAKDVLTGKSGTKITI